MSKTNNKEFNSVVMATLLRDSGKLFQNLAITPEATIGASMNPFSYSGELLEHFTLGIPHKWIIDLDKDLQPLKLSDSPVLDWGLCQQLVVGKAELNEVYLLVNELEDANLTTNWQSMYNDGKPLDIIQLKKNGVDMLKDLRIILEGWDKKPESSETLFSFVDLWLYKYSWLWPSLYDKTRLATAITACCYQQKSVLKNLKAINEVIAKNRFCLIQGNLSGIQKYILGITATQASKRLRARSFYLQALTENIINFLLQEYGLPAQCILQNYGGDFMLLVTSKDDDQVFVKVKQEITTILYKEFVGEITLNLLKSVAFDGQYFCSKDEEKNWQKLTEQFGDEFQSEKMKALQTVLQADNKWNTSEFVHKFAGDEQECDACSKTKVIAEVINGKKFCKTCRDDASLGQELASKPNYLLSFGEGIIPENMKLLESLAINKEKPVRIAVINPDGYKNLSNLIEYSCPLSLNLRANYMPTNSSECIESICKNAVNRGLSKERATQYQKHVEYVLKKNCETLEDEAKIETGEPLPFKAIADLSDGNPMLAVLKAEVDNSDKLFTGGTGQDGNTVSHITTLPRMLDLFFSGYLETIVRQKHPDCYLVYSGGVELLILGPWISILQLAEIIRTDFEKYVQNKELTLSAGIAFTYSKLPLLQAVERAEQELARAKAKGIKELGKGGVALWGTAIEWTSYPKVFVEAEKVVGWLEDSKMDSSSGMSAGFVRNLQAFGRMQNMEKALNDRDRLLSQRWKPLLAYQMSSNIIDRDSDVWKWLQPLITIPSHEKSSEPLRGDEVRQKYLAIIATIAMYQTKKG